VGSFSSGGFAEVSKGFSALWASEKHGIGAFLNELTGGGLQGELVEGKHCSSRGQNSLPSALGDLEAAYCQFWHCQHSLVIQHFAHANHSFISCLCRAFHQTRQGHWVTLDP